MPDLLITRRSLLVGAVGAVGTAALGGLAGCTDDGTKPGAEIVPLPRSRDESTADLLLSNKRWLIQRYMAVTKRHPQLVADLARFVQRHERHRDALTTASPTTTATSRASPQQPQSVPADEAAAVAELASIEAAAGRGRALLVTSAGSGLLAALIASIGACESAQAVSLGAAAGPGHRAASAEGDLSAAEIGALQTALAAEHAAIYAYGVAGAHLAGGDRRAATIAYDDHRYHRDHLAEVIRGTGTEPDAAAPAYALPVDVKSLQAARRLAAYVEEAIGRANAAVVRAAGTGALRLLGARALATATVRHTQWGGPLTAFPGLRIHPDDHGADPFRR